MRGAKRWEVSSESFFLKLKSSGVDQSPHLRTTSRAVLTCTGFIAKTKDREKVVVIVVL